MTFTVSFIPALLVILLAAGIGRLLSVKLNQPLLLGELVLGIIISQFVVLAPAAKSPIADIAEIGIMLLLFSIGLDLDLDRFKEMALPAVGVAAGGIIIPFLLGYFTTLLFNFPITVALFVGAAMVATSVGVSTSILHEAGALKTKVGTLITDSAVIDDVVGVIMMTVLFTYISTGSINLIELAVLIGSSILFFVISLTFGVKAMKTISDRIPIEKENLLLGGIIVLLSFGLITQSLGLVPAIGAFVAGVLVGQTKTSNALAGSVSLIGEGFFIPIFFVHLGMSFKLGALTSVSLFAGVLIVLAIVGKVLGSGLGAKISNLSNKESLATGIAMVPRAEIALIIANFGLERGVITPEISSTILIMVIITTVVTPTPLWKVLKNINKD